MNCKLIVILISPCAGGDRSMWPVVYPDNNRPARIGGPFSMLQARRVWRADCPYSTVLVRGTRLVPVGNALAVEFRGGAL